MISAMGHADEKANTSKNTITDHSNLFKAHDIVMKTNADDIVAKGFQGKQVGDMLHERRVNMYKGTQ
jgi:hypothetical protein